MWITILILMICISLFLYQGSRKLATLPPGLPRYPFIGSGPHLAPNLHVVISQMRKKYGKVFSLYLGNDPFVIVSDFELYKEAMSKDELLYRPKLGANDDFMFPDEHGERRGIMFANGQEWQEQRRFTLRNLRDFGFGKVSMESLIQEEVEKCIEMLSQETGKVTKLSLKLNIAILNALWKLLTGEKLEYDSPKSKEIVERFNDMFRSSNVGGLIRIFPWLKHIIPDYIGYTNMKKVNETVNKMVEESYQAHLDTFDSENIRDFTDAYIKQQLDCKHDVDSSFYGNRGKLNFISILTNLFAAGSDTTSNTILYTLWYLCKFPNVQKKLHDEIISMVGKSRLPSLNDKPNLSYLEATLNEVQRIVGVAFMGIPRLAKTDITIGNSSNEKWIIPKNAIFTGALHEMMRDPDYFENPTDFLPERFLDENGKYRPHEKLVPFGIGKRSCPGKTLADTEIFLFVAAFVQRFQFSFPEEFQPPDEIEPEVGFVLCCPPYDMVIEEH